MKNYLLIGLLTGLVAISGLGPVMAADKEVELAYVEWSSEVASTNVVRAVLQERMGYEIGRAHV